MKFGQVGLESDHDVETEIARRMEEGGLGIETVGDHVIGEVGTELFHGSAEQSNAGGDFVFSRRIRFEIEG